MAVEWFDKLFKEKQDANQHRQHEEAYEKKKREIERLKKLIDDRYDETQEKQRKIIEQMQNDSSA